MEISNNFDYVLTMIIKICFRSQAQIFNGEPVVESGSRDLISDRTRVLLFLVSHYEHLPLIAILGDPSEPWASHSLLFEPMLALDDSEMIVGDAVNSHL